MIAYSKIKEIEDWCKIEIRKLAGDHALSPFAGQRMYDQPYLKQIGAYKKFLSKLEYLRASAHISASTAAKKANQTRKSKKNIQ